MTRSDEPQWTTVPISLAAARRAVEDKIRSTADSYWSGGHSLGIRLLRSPEGLWALDPGDDKSFGFSLQEWSDPTITEWPGDDGRRELALWLELFAAPDNNCTVRGKAVGEMGRRVCRELLLELGATAQAAMDFVGLHVGSSVETPPAARSAQRRGPTRPILERANAMCDIMLRRPHYSQRRLAQSLETTYYRHLRGRKDVSVKIHTIRNTLKAVGWSWEELRKGRVQKISIK